MWFRGSFFTGFALIPGGSNSIDNFAGARVLLFRCTFSWAFGSVMFSAISWLNAA